MDLADVPSQSGPVQKSLSSFLSWSTLTSKRPSFKVLLALMVYSWPTMAAVWRTFTLSFIMDCWISSIRYGGSSGREPVGNSGLVYEYIWMSHTIIFSWILPTLELFPHWLSGSRWVNTRVVLFLHHTYAQFVLLSPFNSSSIPQWTVKLIDFHYQVQISHSLGVEFLEVQCTWSVVLTIEPALCSLPQSVPTL